MGGGYSGPSQAEILAQEEASRQRAQAEASKLKAEQALEQEREGQKVLADRVAMATSDQEARRRTRALLIGAEAEEKDSASLADPAEPEKRSEKKARRATLIAAGGE
ncbi:hypothetical protein [Methylibium petroleiphilum]|nr:hypothetical protein [Methylibium petroleiphilum]